MQSNFNDSCLIGLNKSPIWFDKIVLGPGEFKLYAVMDTL